MRNFRYAAVISLLVLLFSVLVACGMRSEQGPVSTATSVAVSTATPLPTGTPVPTETFSSTRTPFPTPVKEAPKETFASVGNVAYLNGHHDVSGKAIVAGLQTLIIQRFSFDGKGPNADIRLVQGQNYADPAAVLLDLEARSYDEEFLRLIIPSSVGPDDADNIVVYCEETNDVYAVAKFD